MAKLRKKFNERDYEKEKIKVLKLLEEVTLFDDASETERIERCRDDFWAFAHTYLPHYFTTKTQAEWHPTMVDTIVANPEKVIVIAAPRGFSKSTIISFALVLWWIVYQKRYFIVVSMETQDKAEMQTWKTLLELQFNPRLLHDFGKLVSEEAARSDFNSIVTDTRTQPTRLLAFSRGMSARGLANLQYRPDAWINDDLEDRKLARNPKRVDQLEEVVISDNLGAMCAEGWLFVVIGTVICKRSFLDKLLKKDSNEEDDGFIRLKFRAIENMDLPTARSTWEELHPLRKLLSLLKIMRRPRFMAEKQNTPIDVGSQFDERWFRYIRALPAEYDYSRQIEQIDPSYSEGGDNKACYVMGSYAHTPARKDWNEFRDMKGKPIEEGHYTIVARPYNRKAPIDDFITEVFKRFERWKPYVIKCDGSFAQKKMYQREFSRVEVVKGYNLPVKFTDQQRNKEEKISELEPLIQRGAILFLFEESEDMENTIIQFTRHGEPGIPDDGPDDIAEGIESLKRENKKARVTLV
jgi:hypothetical protein